MTWHGAAGWEACISLDDVRQKNTVSLLNGRLLFTACFGAVGGILCAVYLPWYPVLYVCGIALATGLVIALKKAGHRLNIAFALLSFFLFSLGAGYASHPTLPPEGTYFVQGVIEATAKVDEDGHTAVFLRDVQLQSASGDAYQVSSAYWTYYQTVGENESPVHPPQAGTVVHFEASLYHPSGATNPCGFDFRLYLLQSGTTIGLYSSADYETDAQRKIDLMTLAADARSAISSRIDELFSGHSDLVKALLLGQRDGLPEETRDAFSKAGVAHILAVSGLHIGLLSGFLLLILRKFLYPGAQTIAMAVFLLIYCWLLNFMATAVRASILLLAGMYARGRGRGADSLSVLSAAFLMILLVQPMDLFSNGFILSFSAVLGIYLLRDVFGRVLRFIRSGRIRSSLSVTCAAFLGTGIPSAMLFHRLSLVALAINPVISLLLSFMMPGYLVILALSCVFPSFAALLGNIMGYVNAFFEQMIVSVGDLPFASFTVPSIPVWFIPFFVLLCYVLSPYCAMRKKSRVCWICALFAAGCVGHLVTIDRGLSYTQLSLGNADCAVVQDGQKTLVIDAGDDASDLVSYLQAKGRHVNTLVITHLHADHIGGVRQLLDEEIRIDRVILPRGAEDQQIAQSSLDLLEELKQTGAEIVYVTAGDTLDEGQIHAEILWPVGENVRTGQDANDYSLCMLLEMGGCRLYTAGDVTGNYECYGAQGADILKVSHHGSKSSTGEEFLEQVSPAVAVISASGGNGHPSDAVLDRLQDTQVLCTDSCGAVRIDFQNGQYTLSAYLREGGMEQP